MTANEFFVLANLHAVSTSTAEAINVCVLVLLPQVHNIKPHTTIIDFKHSLPRFSKSLRSASAIAHG
jgi:hypothetical protein